MLENLRNVTVLENNLLEILLTIYLYHLHTVLMQQGLKNRNDIEN